MQPEMKLIILSYYLYGFHHHCPNLDPFGPVLILKKAHHDRVIYYFVNCFFKHPSTIETMKLFYHFSVDKQFSATST